MWKIDAFRVKRDGLKAVQQKRYLQISTKEKRAQHSLQTLHTLKPYPIFSKLLKILRKRDYGTGALFESSVTKSSRGCVGRCDVMKNSEAAMAPLIHIALYPSNTLMSIAKYFTPLFEI